MSYNPTFPAEFYAHKALAYHMLFYGSGLVLMFGGLLYLTEFSAPKFLNIAMIGFCVIAVLLTLFGLYEILFPKPLLIIHRYYLVYYHRFSQKTIHYRNIARIEINSGLLGRGRATSPELYFLLITTKEEELISIPLPNTYYQGTLYNPKEIHHLIRQAYNGEKLNYQGVNMGESFGAYTL